MSALHNTNCARPECGNKIPPTQPYKLIGREDLYCSRNCVEWAYNEYINKKRKARPAATMAEAENNVESTVDVTAEEFGDAGIVRKFCDNPACRRPITLGWKGRNGEYCSNDCLKITEKEGNKTMPTEESTTTATAPAPPISGGSKKKTPTPKPAAKPAAKATSKKTAAKPAAAKKPAKKAAAKEPGEGRAAAYERSFVIHHTDTFKDCRSLKGEGTSAKRVKAIKDGMTVGDYLEALKKAGLPAGTGNLQACEKGGFITIKKS